METQTIETVRMDNGDLILCCAPSESWGVNEMEFTVKNSDTITTYTESTMKEVYNISDNDVWVIKEFLEVKHEIV